MEAHIRRSAHARAKVQEYALKVARKRAATDRHRPRLRRGVLLMPTALTSGPGSLTAASRRGVAYLDRRIPTPKGIRALKEARGARRRRLHQWANHQGVQSGAAGIKKLHPAGAGAGGRHLRLVRHRRLVVLQAPRGRPGLAPPHRLGIGVGVGRVEEGLIFRRIPILPDAQRDARLFVRIQELGAEDADR